MSFYGNHHRSLQDKFQSRDLADRLEALIVVETLDDRARDFISTQDCFYLSTVDHLGFPSVSYKGGDVGFVKMPDNNTLVFPCFDGNGMFFSMGNIEAHPQVGLLFIDYEAPHRVRVQGTATLTADKAITGQWPEVALAVVVTIHKLWVNCPRYIHKHQRIEASKFVPRAGIETPQPEWKTMDMIADVVPPAPHHVPPSQDDG